MSESFEKWEGLTDHLKAYVNTRVELTKLQIAEKVSLIVSQLIAVAIVALFFLLFLIFGSIAGAWALSNWIGKPYSGFLIVAGIYLVLGILVWLTRARLLRFPIMNAVIKQFQKKDNDDEPS